MTRSNSEHLMHLHFNSVHLNLQTMICRKDNKDSLHVGFCFSFPVDQTSIENGKIVVMTKRFTNPGAAGAEPSRLLEEACEKAGRKVLSYFDQSCI